MSDPTECLAETASVSLIVPCYKSGPTLPATLRSLTALEEVRPIEIILVDSSQDGTVERMRALFPQIRIISRPHQTSPGAARNIGALAAEGELLGFVDADVTVASDWLAQLLSAKLSCGAVLAGGSVGNANPGPVPSRVLYWIEFSDFLPGHPSGFRSHLSSSNLILSRSAFLEAGGFREDFLMAEDLILTRRFAGRCYFASSARVAHRHREGWDEVCRHLERLGYWSGLYRSQFRSSGSWLKAAPILGFGLPVWRLCRILKRLQRADRKEFRSALTCLTPLARGLNVWRRGFISGLRGRPQPEAGSSR